MPSVPGYVGTITAPGSTGQQTYTLPAGSGTVKALLLWWTEQTAAGSAAHARFSYGFGTYRGGVVQQVFGATSSTDAGGTAVGATETGTNAIAVLHDEGTTTRDGEIDLVSLGDAQFVLDWVNLPTTASTLLNYVALCGTGFTDAMAGTFQSLNVAGAQDVTIAAGFGQPDLLLTLNPGSNTNGAVDPWGANTEIIGLCIGAGIKDGARRASLLTEDDGSTTMDVSSVQEQGIAFTTDAAGQGWDGEIDLNPSSGWPTDGFEINRIQERLLTIGYLALKGTFNKALSARQTPTATGNSDYNVGFSNQKVALCWGTNIPTTAASENLTHADLGQFWVGACDSLGNEAWKGWSQDDGNGNADTFSYHSSAKTVQMHSGAAGTLLLEADGSFSTTNFRLNYNDADATAREFNALVIGWDSGAAHTASPSDTLSLADARAHGRGKTVADASALTDAFARTTQTARTVPDTVALTDLLAKASAMARAINDTVSLADVAALGRGLGVADTVGLTDAQAKAVGKALADLVAVADQLTRVVESFRTIPDTVAVTDAASTARAIARTINDSVTLADEATPDLTVGGAEHTREVDDTVGLADARALARGKAVADTLSLADQLAAAKAAAKAVDDSVALADARAISQGQAIADTLSVTDSAAPAAAKAKAVNDTLALTDALSRTTQTSRIVPDTVAVTDDAATAAAKARAVNDSVTLDDQVTTDLTSGSVSHSRDIDDTVTLADARAFSRGLSHTDPVTLTDLLTSAQTFSRVLTDTLTVTDAFARGTAASRTVADTVALTDALTRAAEYARTFADTLTTTDDLAAALSRTVSIDDTVALTDSVATSHTVGVEYAFTVDDEIALTDMLTSRITFHAGDVGTIAFGTVGLNSDPQVGGRALALAGSVAGGGRGSIDFGDEEG